jgi:hypothetical protein
MTHVVRAAEFDRSSVELGVVQAFEPACRTLAGWAAFDTLRPGKHGTTRANLVNSSDRRDYLYG